MKLKQVLLFTLLLFLGLQSCKKDDDHLAKKSTPQTENSSTNSWGSKVGIEEAKDFFNKKKHELVRNGGVSLRSDEANGDDDILTPFHFDPNWFEAKYTVYEGSYDLLTMPVRDS